MITKITGKLLLVAEDFVTLGVGPYEYEILIPEFTRRQLQALAGTEVQLFTIEYLDGNPMHGRLTPRMIGFITEVEREFFELFCSVDGVGVKKALRAMVRPVQDVASAIEDQDTKSLAALPGVGPAMSERIIAKLRRKVPKFALLVGHDLPAESDTQRDVLRETFDALRMLGHSESDARRLIDGALGGKKKYKDVQELLQAVYQHSRGQG